MAHSAVLDQIKRASGGAAATPDFLHLVKIGFPVETLDSVAVEIAPAQSQFLDKIVPRASLARYKSRATNDGVRRLSQQTSERLFRVCSLWFMANDVFHNKDKAWRFLTTPNLMLAERKPWDVALDSEAGGRRVENILGRIQYGAAA
ncbi:antitoxin Xre/MbcA/ParS toxin-binding domain-containing protein [Asticcacaulis sp. EMRT-3]|uniref:antitoxin Xre/MbcA/ParS toxin-binding domain-containing protein n=1 Tax=Asticcacaulis sp. EMRT-3 TaxID=3040349 RepID=UPI0024AECE11|nr:antitoxin Xre/MbcA/ParS toxin-binding domain-containing protein [Asticcacaulis sp. EMRT-3]MDI7776596.1 DUF2384 domain-containing protein [Asticcacaulis sp. EMRT-3]